MAKINRYQGEDIPFFIKVWKDLEKTTAVNLDEIANITIYIYTDACKKAMFAKTSILPGNQYTKLIRIDEYTYSAVLDSSKTKLMEPGTLILEINLADDVSMPGIKLNTIQKSNIGRLVKSFIKTES